MKEARGEKKREQLGGRDHMTLSQDPWWVGTVGKEALSMPRGRKGDGPSFQAQAGLCSELSREEVEHGR